ncbi:MAG: LysR family transcriptional regulator [Solimonas sp.]
MSVDLLPDLSLFLAVARLRSFARAAVERRVSRSAVSHAIRALEDRLGVRLFHRTTRSVTLTEAGASLLASLTPALDAVETALAGVDSYRNMPRGTLRLNVPRGVAYLVEAILPPFLAANPEVRVEVTTSDALVDIVRDGFDAGVRFGESLEKDMIAVPFGPRQRFAAVASPEYFASRPRPESPADLTNHACIVRRFPSGATHQWEFEKEERKLTVAVNGPVTSDDQALILRLACAGAGIAQLFESEVRRELENGRLIRVLDDWTPSFDGYYLYYAGRRQLPAPLRAFVDCLRLFDAWPIRT